MFRTAQEQTPELKQTNEQKATLSKQIPKGPQLPGRGEGNG